MWAFMIAAALLIIGGFAPLAFGAGGTNRLAGVIIPFAVGAAAMGLNAFMSHQSRPLAAGLYFIAGIAITYGILALLAVPLRLAVVGTCPPGSHCPIGFESGLTANETSGLSIAVALGIVAVLTGFFGLLVTYRRRPTQPSGSAKAWPDRPPEPAPAPKPAAPPEPKPEPPAAVAAVPAAAAPEPEPAAPPPAAPPPQPEPMPELGAPPEMLELPPPPSEPISPPPAAPRPQRPRRKPKPAPAASSDEEPPPAPPSV